jgi:hypothetical protein
MSFRFGRISPFAARTLTALSFVTLLGGAACSQTDDAAPGAAVTGNEDDIIGGVDASGAGLNAIGTLGREGFDGEFDYFCTATLVAPTVVLSAKHCLQDGPDGIYFAVGPDSKAPLQKVKVKSVKTAPDESGGFVKLGQDVALVVLESPITDVTPLKYINGHIPEAKVGTKLTAVGFGVHDRQRNSGVRRAGALTLQAVSGQPMHKLFATLDDLLKLFVGNDGQEYVDQNRERLATFYDLTLKDSSEAYLGLGADDAQPCSGDSGGPLIGRIGNRNVVFAVVSGSFKTRTYPCSVVGEVYATLPPLVQDMLAEAIGNNDQAIDPLTGAADADRGPCGYTTVRGHCEGVRAVRCVSDSEGPQKVTKTDCSLIGQICGVDAQGNAGCVDDLTAGPGGAGGASSGGSGAAGASSGGAGAAGASGGEGGAGGASGAEAGAAGAGGEQAGAGGAG